jgi:hypothetical protein
MLLRASGVESLWDGTVKTMVYNTVTMEWEAQTTTAINGGAISTLTADTSSIETRSRAMKTVVDEANATVTYVGEAATGSALSGSVWRIKRLTQAGTVLLTEWADGDGLFNNVWNNRASLTYS